MKNFLHRIFEDLCWIFLLVTTPPDHPEQPDPEMNRSLKKFLEASWLNWLWTMKGEIFLCILGIVLFFHALPWLRAFDPTAAGLDGGTLSFPLVGVVAVIVGIILFFIFVRLVVPWMDKWFDGEECKYRPGIESDWFNTTPAVRIAVFFALLGCFILGVCVVTAAAF